MKILLIEEDVVVIAAVNRSLSAYRYVVDTVTDGETGWTYATTFEYDLIVLDVCLPKLDGLSFCHRFRAEGYLAPILFLTAKGSSLDKVEGLDAGADDYMVKPFDGDELSARIRALLRRSSASPFPQMAWGDLVLNPSTCEVSYREHPLTLTTKEYELLELFLRDCHCVFSAEEILDRLWSSEEFPAEATVRSHLRRLRKKLSAAGAPPDFIATIHGRGYFLKTPLEEAQPPATTAPLTSTRSLSELQLQAAPKRAWAAAQSDSLAQIAILSQTLAIGSLDRSLSSGQQIVQQLRKTLERFQLTEGSQIAHDLEQMLLLPSEHRRIASVTAHLEALTDLVQNVEQAEICQIPILPAPLLLIFDPDAAAEHNLRALAACAGLRTEIASTLTDAKAWLRPDFNRVQQPDAILLKLSTPSLPHLESSSFDFNFLRELAGTYFEIPILVMGQAFDLYSRLDVLQCGGTFLLDASLPADAVIAAVQQCLNSARKGAKVMVLDPDQDLLRTLPTILNPWGFKVSTLVAPEQFWSVLEAVSPDALVLEVKLPQINGLEICQILRSELKWRQMPILFLSSISDPQTEQHAFDIGADDFLRKPIVGTDLARRILNRLQRYRTWSN